MAIADDFTIDYVNKRLYHSSGTTIYSTNALYTYVMDTFDELAQMDDTVPMSAQTPTDYTLINGWFVDDDSFKYLKGGAVKTDGQLNEIRVISFTSSAYVNAGTSDIGRTITGGSTGDTAKLLAYNNTTRKWWVRMVDSGDTFANASEHITIASSSASGNMSAISTTGENLWANIYTLGTIEQHANEEQIYIIQNGTALTSWWPDSSTPSLRHIDVLIKVKESSSLVDAGKVTVFLRNYPTTGNADLYDNFEINLSAGGRNAVPLATSPDLNNLSTHATISAYSDISVVFVNGTITHGAIAGGSGVFTEFETITGGTSLATAKFVKDITGTMTLGNIDGTFQNGEVLTGGTSGCHCTTTSTLTVARTTTKNFEQGSNYNYTVLINCATRALSQVYEYLKYLTRENSKTYYTYGTKTLSAVLSINKLAGEQYITPYTDFDTPTNTYSPTKAAPFGTFAGGKFFGARGVWIQNMASSDIQNFQLIDSDNSTQTPPNKQSIVISNLLSGDRISVFRTTTGTTINKAMFTAANGNNLGNNTFVVNEAISSDTPSSGVIRIVNAADTTSTRETRYTYTSWSGSTFTGISPTLDRSYTATNDTCYVPFIDTTASSSSASVTVIYTTDRNILVRVRRYAATAILPFETTGSFTISGYSTSAIRTTDSIVS
jgi:hypothetical protein